MRDDVRNFSERRRLLREIQQKFFRCSERIGSRPYPDHRLRRNSPNLPLNRKSWGMMFESDVKRVPEKWQKKSNVDRCTVTHFLRKKRSKAGVCKGTSVITRGKRASGRFQKWTQIYQGKNMCHSESHRYWHIAIKVEYRVLLTWLLPQSSLVRPHTWYALQFGLYTVNQMEEGEES